MKKLYLISALLICSINAAENDVQAQQEKIERLQKEVRNLKEELNRKTQEVKSAKRTIKMLAQELERGSEEISGMVDTVNLSGDNSDEERNEIKKHKREMGLMLLFIFGIPALLLVYIAQKNKKTKKKS